jgi:hypothetical protein
LITRQIITLINDRFFTSLRKYLNSSFVDITAQVHYYIANIRLSKI